MKGTIHPRTVCLKIAIHLCLVATCALFLYPLFIMFAATFKNATELSRNPTGLATAPTLNNLRMIFSMNDGLFLRSLLNSFGVSTVSVLLSVMLAALAAFAFAKYRFAGRNLLFHLLMITVMVPTETLLAPLYIMMSRFGWISTYAVQILPDAAKVMTMFLIRQYMLSIPDSLLDAARIDGAGHWAVFFRVAAPVASPVLVTVSILNFIGKWSEYLWPMIMVNKTRFQPVMVVLPALSVYEGSSSGMQYQFLMAGCTVATVPILILFLALNKRIMMAVTAGAVKG